MVQWASVSKFIIPNTVFGRPFDEQWTYVNGTNMWQFDYALIDTLKVQWLADAVARDSIGVGADHRTLEVVLRRSAGRGRVRKRQPRAVRTCRDADQAQFSKNISIQVYML